MLDSPAKFKSGDMAIFYSQSVDDDDHGMPVKIVSEYELRGVINGKGCYIIQEDGRRCIYQWATAHA